MWVLMGGDKRKLNIKKQRAKTKFQISDFRFQIGVGSDLSGLSDWSEGEGRMPPVRVRGLIG